MKRVKFISAGAGSGKTYSLISHIVDFIKNKTCHSDQIILTTFTVAAAEELREKVRKALYEEGLYDEAVMLDNAAIGTIHSIAFSMVKRYWYHLGISPEVRLIAEDALNLYKEQSLGALPEDKELEIFREIREIFNITKKDDFSHDVPDIKYWQSDLSRIIDKIEDYGISQEDLKYSCNKSWNLISEVLDLKSQESVIMPSADQINVWLDEIIDSCDLLNNGNPAQKKQNFKDLQSTFLKDVSINPFGLKPYMDLVTAVKKNASKTLQKFCGEQIDRLLSVQNDMLRNDSSVKALKKYIETLFGLTFRWLKEYQTFKRERKLLDFNDTQSYFSLLLNNQDVVKEIKSRYKVMLVDEFQDCSPQQVKFFGNLSEMMERSVWVGDIKQSIYGFRGTDTRRIMDMIESISLGMDGNHVDRLENCWRSNGNIVGLVNSVFQNAFSQLPSEMVTLALPEKKENYNRPLERRPVHFHINIPSANLKYEGITNVIKYLRDEEGLDFNDIAILFHTNSEVTAMAQALEKVGFPVRIPGKGAPVEESPALNLLNSIVSFAANSRNELSKALIAYYTEPGQSASRILSERLKILSSEEDFFEVDSLNDNAVIREIEALRSAVVNQSLAHAVETLLVELDVQGLLKRLDPDADAYKMVSRYCEAASQYEALSGEMGLQCSLSGFKEWIENRGISHVGNENGITVMTYHGSKGLEWKCVVLGSLEQLPYKKSEIFFQVNVLREDYKSILYLCPKFIQKFCSDSIKERIENHDVFKKLNDSSFEEAKRLLYVGMTRPKELLVSLTLASARSQNRTDWVDLISGVPTGFYDRQEAELQWFGHTFRNLVIDYVGNDSQEESEEKSARVAVLKRTTGRPSYETRNVVPSSMSPLSSVAGAEIAASFASRLKASVRDADDAVLGNCIHRLLCVYRDDEGFAQTVKSVTSAHGVLVQPEDFMTQAKKMFDWLKDTYGNPTEIEREVPFSFLEKEGRIVNGEIDLVYRTVDGDVLIDYKTCLRPIGEILDHSSKFYAGKYSGQLALYEKALSLAGRTLRDNIICYFNLGTAVRLLFKD